MLRLALEGQGHRLSPEEMEPERVRVWAELKGIRARYPAPALSSFLPAPSVVRPAKIACIEPE